jgi:hypothetical protein
MCRILMKDIITIIPVGLYLSVSAISFIMAYKSIFSNTFLPFHGQAAGMSWDTIDRSLQFVVIALMRVSGLGFLVIALLLMISPIINYFNSHIFLKYGMPVIALMYCIGLFVINFALYKKTKAPTPWKGSLYAGLIIFTGIVISSL